MDSRLKKYLSEIGKRGGSKTSAAKTRAARRNARKRWARHRKEGK